MKICTVQNQIFSTASKFNKYLYTIQKNDMQKNKVKLLVVFDKAKKKHNG